MCNCTVCTLENHFAVNCEQFLEAIIVLKLNAVIPAHSACVSLVTLNEEACSSRKEKKKKHVHLEKQKGKKESFTDINFVFPIGAEHKRTVQFSWS